MENSLVYIICIGLMAFGVIALTLILRDILVRRAREKMLAELEKKPKPCCQYCGHPDIVIWDDEPGGRGVCKECILVVFKDGEED